MKWPHYLKYILRDTFRALVRHKGMALLSILTITITTFVFGMTGLIALNSQNAATQVENELEMIVYLAEESSQNDVTSVGEQIRRLPEVSTVTFISKDKALADLDKRFEDHGTLKESLNNENPLPDAYKVKLKKAEESEKAVQKLEKIPRVQEVLYGEEIVQNVLKLNQSVKVFLAFIIALLVFATIFLTNSTISLTVAHRNQEIRIMNIVGAAPSFIRFPFFLEGIIIGSIGSLLSVLGLYFGYQHFEQAVRQSLPFLPIYDRFDVVVTFLALLLISGIIIGALGSAMAVRKYLKI